MKQPRDDMLVQEEIIEVSLLEASKANRARSTSLLPRKVKTKHVAKSRSCVVAPPLG